MAEDKPSQKKVCTPSYFSSLSGTYALQTGNSTSVLFTSLLPRINALHPFSPSSIVHDNAAGPGTAAAATLGFLEKELWPREILITDNNADMISVAGDIFKDVPGKVEARVLDSQTLEGLPADYFTHSLCNISLFMLPDTVAAMARVRETLAPGGVVIFTNWSRFGAGFVTHAAQRAIRPDLPPLRVPAAHHGTLEYLSTSAEGAGFEKDKIETFHQSLKVEEGAWLDGLRGFFANSPLFKGARKEWSAEEEERWMEEVEKAIQGEIKEFGGVYFEAAVLIARK